MSPAWFNGNAMSQLAKQTGGQFFEDSNDLLKGDSRCTIQANHPQTKEEASSRQIGYWSTPSQAREL
jgi:hypothetical protein